MPVVMALSHSAQRRYRTLHLFLVTRASGRSGYGQCHRTMRRGLDRDRDGCQWMQYDGDVSIMEPAALTASTSATASSCQVCDATASAMVAGGTAPYVFAWSLGGTSSAVMPMPRGSAVVHTACW